MPKIWTGSEFKMPERLYRYRPLAGEKDWDYLEQILLNSTMYGAPPGILQKMDPEDCRVAVNTLCTLDEFKRSSYGQEVTQQHSDWSESESDSYLRQYHKNLMKPDFNLDVVNALQGSADQYGVICFSTDGDIPTQWRSYASEGRGVCLELDPLKDVDFFRKVKPVNYVDVLEPANVFTDTTEVQVRKRLYTKLDKYESEDEFRALFERGAGQQIPFRPEALVEVKPGLAMNEVDRRRLKVILRRRMGGALARSLCTEHKSRGIISSVDKG
ncbi:MAG TPA: DUF2971 domain-containing protein [Thermoanaerobaculia bacterium]|jgi:hypothetical protein|nr:DUF2971 domain-containing protein [Thermoanaerobaculia bacterium]